MSERQSESHVGGIELFPPRASSRPLGGVCVPYGAATNGVWCHSALTRDQENLETTNRFQVCCRLHGIALDCTFAGSLSSEILPIYASPECGSAQSIPRKTFDASQRDENVSSLES